jgi:hypothetical protein
MGRILGFLDSEEIFDEGSWADRREKKDRNGSSIITTLIFIITFIHISLKG